MRSRPATEHPKWRGGRTLNHGYIWLRTPGHPRAQTAGHYVREHILVAERALGRPLPTGAEVHHVNSHKKDNRNQNLVLCGHGYHMLLERRTRAFRDSGHADWLRCHYCHSYAPKDEMYVRPNGWAWHRPCRNLRDRQRKSERRISL
jgi:hypothetical protein